MERNEAFAAGQLTYTTGRPCKHGHTSPRYTKSGICQQCNRDNVKTFNTNRNALMGRKLEQLTLFVPLEHHQAVREYANLLTLMTPRARIEHADTPAARISLELLNGAPKPVML